MRDTCHSRRSVLSVLAGAAGGMHSLVAAQQRSTRLLVPAPPAGTTDFVARAVAGALERESADSVVIHNLPGAGGTLATDALFAAPPDGSVLLVSPNSLVTEVPYT